MNRGPSSLTKHHSERFQAICNWIDENRAKVVGTRYTTTEIRDMIGKHMGHRPNTDMVALALSMKGIEKKNQRGRPRKERPTVFTAYDPKRVPAPLPVSEQQGVVNAITELRRSLDDRLGTIQATLELLVDHLVELTKPSPQSPEPLPRGWATQSNEDLAS